MCIFCKIVSGELPSLKVYEDDYVLAFLDISPINHGHTVVIPKKHFEIMEDIDDICLAKIMRVVKKVGKAIKEGMDIEGYNVGLNNDPVAGRVVPHLHFHIIPRNKTDNLSLWPGSKYGEGEAEETLKKIKSKI